MSTKEMKDKNAPEGKDIEVNDGNDNTAATDKKAECGCDANNKTCGCGGDCDCKDGCDTETGEKAEPTLEEQLETAKKEADSYKDKYLRAVAEFDNYRKRTIKEKADLLLNGSEKTVCAVLPVLDDFERALANATDDAKAMKEGMTLIFNKFNKTLESLGVKKIETEGKDFDVDYHEAVAMVPGMGDDKKGKVIDCVQTGYQLNDKVIRHAKVAVGQ